MNTDLIPQNCLWKEELPRELEYVKKHGFYLKDIPTALNSLNFGILLMLPKNISEELYQSLKTHIPAKLAEKLYFQPAEGYHISLQYTYQYVEIAKAKEIYKDITEALKSKKQFVGDLHALYVSDNSVLAVADLNKNYLHQIRTTLGEIFKKHNYDCKFDASKDVEYFNIWGASAWASLIRFTQQLTLDEIEILENLPKKVFEKVEFNRVIVANNNPFFTKDKSEVVGEVGLE